MIGEAPPATSERAVCVTGMGWTTALGSGIDEVWQRLLRGASGIAEVPTQLRLRSRLAAALPAADAPGAPDGRRQHDDVAVRTAQAALHDAGLTPDAIDLLVLGTSLGPHLDDPSWPSLHQWAESVGDRLGISRPPLSLSTACSSGADAIALAATMIRTGAADRCLCGGVDLLTDGKRLGHSALGTMSPTLLRPFDTRRDGTVLGEGAGFLVLEAADVADHDSTREWGRLSGWGGSNDAAGPTKPDASGVAASLAVIRALRRAGAEPGDVAVVNAHATGTLGNDAAEARCYALVFGAQAPRPLVFATKGAFGHTLGATGAIEAIALLLALHHGVAPPVPLTHEVMPPLPLPLAAPDAVPFDGALGISLTLGFGGFNTCLALSRGIRAQVAHV